MVGRIDKHTPANRPQETPSAPAAVHQQKKAINQYMQQKGNQLLGAGKSPTVSKQPPNASDVTRVTQAIKSHLQGRT